MVGLMDIRNHLRNAVNSRDSILTPPSAADLRRAIDCAIRDLDTVMRLQKHDPNQMALIEPEIGRTRVTDPDTSHEAAASIPAYKLSQIRLAILLALDHDPYHMTDDLIILALGRVGFNQAYSTIRTRRKECVDMGWVGDSGRRIRTHSGRKMILWSITDAGRKILREEGNDDR